MVAQCMVLLCLYFLLEPSSRDSPWSVGSTHGAAQIPSSALFICTCTFHNPFNSTRIATFALRLATQMESGLSHAFGHQNNSKLRFERIIKAAKGNGHIFYILDCLYLVLPGGQPIDKRGILRWVCQGLKQVEASIGEGANHKQGGSRQHPIQIS